jgi:hypothetical protein
LATGRERILSNAFMAAGALVDAAEASGENDVLKAYRTKKKP